MDPGIVAFFSSQVCHHINSFMLQSQKAFENNILKVIITGLTKEANLYHLFRSCSKVNAFWHNIYTGLLIMFGTKILIKWDDLVFGHLCYKY